MTCNRAARLHAGSGRSHTPTDDRFLRHRSSKAAPPAEPASASLRGGPQLPAAASGSASGDISPSQMDALYLQPPLQPPQYSARQEAATIVDLLVSGIQVSLIAILHVCRHTCQLFQNRQAPAVVGGSTRQAKGGYTGSANFCLRRTCCMVQMEDTTLPDLMTCDNASSIAMNASAVGSIAAPAEAGCPFSLAFELQQLATPHAAAECDGFERQVSWQPSVCSTSSDVSMPYFAAGSLLDSRAIAGTALIQPHQQPLPPLPLASLCRGSTSLAAMQTAPHTSSCG